MSEQQTDPPVDKPVKLADTGKVGRPGLTPPGAGPSLGGFPLGRGLPGVGGGTSSAPRGFGAADGGSGPGADLGPIGGPGGFGRGGAGAGGMGGDTKRPPRERPSYLDSLDIVDFISADGVLQPPPEDYDG